MSAGNSQVQLAYLRVRHPHHETSSAVARIVTTHISRSVIITRAYMGLKMLYYKNLIKRQLYAPLKHLVHTLERRNGLAFVFIQCLVNNPAVLELHLR